MERGPGKSGRGSPPPSVTRIVDEGLLIALSAVRMAVKNRIIIGALRDHSDFDDADYPGITRQELDRLARQNEADARRVTRARKKLVKLRWTEAPNNERRGDIRQLVLRRRVYEALAVALHAVSGDDGKVAELVETARTDASEEVGQALTVRLIEREFDRVEPDYLVFRGERMEALAGDLAALRRTPRGDADPT